MKTLVFIGILFIGTLAAADKPALCDDLFQPYFPAPIMQEVLRSHGFNQTETDALVKDLQTTYADELNSTDEDTYDPSETWDEMSEDELDRAIEQYESEVEQERIADLTAALKKEGILRKKNQIVELFHMMEEKYFDLSDKCFPSDSPIDEVDN